MEAARVAWRRGARRTRLAVLFLAWLAGAPALAALASSEVEAPPASADGAARERAQRSRRARRLRAERLRAQREQRARRAQREQHAIDRFCDRLADLAEDRERRRLFALLPQGPAGAWLEYRNARTLQKALKIEGAFQVAEVWIREDGATAIAITLGGGTRGSARFVDYCFRADGSLARMASPLDVADPLDSRAGRHLKRYFEATGSPLLRALPARAPEPQPVYKTLAELPFASLLSEDG